VYGLDDQPLHTDGAHLRTTPDVVILHCTVPSATSTRAWKFAGEGAPWNALRHGMFIVRNYDESFFAPALTGRVFRFDPACMSACDDRAFEVLDFFAQRLDESAEHRWIEEDTVLVLDNHSTLHARSKVVSDDLGRELTRLAFKTSAAQ